MIADSKIAALVAAILALAFLTILRGFRRRLRQPPARFEEIVALSHRTKAPLPQALRVPQVRRQLMLASSRPAELTNMLQMDTKTLNLNKVEKKPIIYGILHPNADAAGGGERVLWAVVHQVVSQDPKAIAVLYVRSDVTQVKCLQMAAERFGIQFSGHEANRVVLISLMQTWLVDASTFPLLTMLGQAIGMAVLGYEAIANLMPDVFIETTGLAFSYPIVSWFAKIPVLSYTHYPFIQDEMLYSLRQQTLIKSPRRMLKYIYWRTLQVAYNWAGSYANEVSVNSTWTKNNLEWKVPTKIVYPPSAVQDFAAPSETEERTPALVFLAQFRPEKRHELVIRSFAKLKQLVKKSAAQVPSRNRKPHLILIGSVRHEGDQMLVQQLHALAQGLGLTEMDFTIVQNAPWDAVQKILRSSLVGLNAMWNEHFGMGVVEVMAAGLIPVVHASAGPYLDIVKDEEGAPGFFFRSAKDPDGPDMRGFPPLSEAMLSALSLKPEEQKALSQRAYKSAQRFSDTEFAKHWQKQLDVVTALVPQYAAERKKLSLFD